MRAVQGRASPSCWSSTIVIDSRATPRSSRWRSTSDPSQVQAFFEENGGDWPVIAEGNGGFALQYGVVKLPESYLIAPDGTVVYKFDGGVTADGIDSIIDQLTTPSDASSGATTGAGS